MKKKYLPPISHSSFAKSLGMIGFVLFIVLFQPSVQAANFQQSLENVSVTIPSERYLLGDFFKVLEKNTDFKFAYANQNLDLKKAVDIPQGILDLKSVLEKLSLSHHLLFERIENTIIVRRLDTKTTSIQSRVIEERKISGVVMDQSGAPMPGATVLAKGTTNGTITDADGKFSLIVPDEAQVLLISFIGYETQEVAIVGLTTIEVKLSESTSSLNEVIVTALGIRRNENEVGYAEQTVDAELLSTAVAPNWSNGLQGKVAGLNIISGGTGPINSQSIQLRGSTSLAAGGNSALIVVDGVPLNQQATAFGDGVNASYGTEAPVDYGNAISELNQDDIESVTVLKGPAAAALYGSRAGNGALIITTKSGKKGKRLGVSINSSTIFEEPTNWPNYQYRYGAGNFVVRNDEGNQYYSYGNSEDGVSTNVPQAWGAKFDGQYYYQYDPTTQAQGAERTLWRPYENNMKDFYNTGTTFINSVALEGGDDKGAMRLNLTHADNNYIVPNTGYKKNGISLNANYQVSERIKLSTVVNYNQRTSDNLPGFGLSNGSLGYFMMFLMPNVDINWYKPIWENGQENLTQLNPFSQWSSNPYFLSYVDLNKLKSNQIVGNVSADIKITDHLSVMGRLALNSLSQLRESERGYSSKKHAKGYYGRQDISSQEINADFLLTYKNSISGIIDYEVRAGGNRMSFVHRDVMSSVDALISPGVYNLSNGINLPLVETRDALKDINSLYGMATLSWKENIIVDITGRNDWSSTLPAENNSYFYPSVSSSFLLSNMLQLPEKISFLKYRASFAQVGSDANPYQTSKYFGQSSFPSSAVVPGALFNTHLKPEITSGFETGFVYKMFENRVGIDFTYYASTTKNQILTLPADIAAGYSSRVINAGEVRNRGIEIVLTGTPVLKGDFSWDITGNWSMNRNKILSLADNLERQTLANVWQGYLIASVGGTTSDLYGTKFIRDEDGNVVYNNGLPTRTTTQEYIGNSAPDWKFGLTNTVTYKGFRASLTVDGQVGGLIYSGTYNRASWAGTTTNTIPGRDEGFIIGEGVSENADGSYSTNTFEIDPQAYYVQYHQTTEAGVFDATFLKIRELTFNYSFPNKITQPLGIYNLSAGIYGRNLAVFDKFPMWDPEAGTMNSNGFVPGMEVTPMPYTASYGANIKLSF